MDLKRVDAWFVKGFEGAANLVIQRSQHPVSLNCREQLRISIANLEKALSMCKSIPPTLDCDFQLFSLLLELSTMLLARVESDRSFDGQAIENYLKTLRTALKRMDNE